MMKQHDTMSNLVYRTTSKST